MLQLKGLPLEASGGRHDRVRLSSQHSGLQGQTVMTEAKTHLKSLDNSKTVSLGHPCSLRMDVILSPKHRLTQPADLTRPGSPWAQWLVWQCPVVLLTFPWVTEGTWHYQGDKRMHLPEPAGKSLVGHLVLQRLADGLTECKAFQRTSRSAPALLPGTH